jgi:hypothetical protein
MDWFLTGIGQMFIPDNSPEIINIENKNGIVNMKNDGVIRWVMAAGEPLEKHQSPYS